MINLFIKIFKTPKNIISVNKNELELTKINIIGKKIQDHVSHLFQGSLAIRQIDAGSDNACEQELVALSNSFYDVERFGIHFVASPRHADLLLITGPITRNMVEPVKRAYNATPDPKIVVVVGDDAINGGIFRGSYAILDDINSVIPVDYQIPGNPPSPKIILYHLLNILESLNNKSRKSK